MRINGLVLYTSNCRLHTSKLKGVSYLLATRFRYANLYKIVINLVKSYGTTGIGSELG